MTRAKWLWHRCTKCDSGRTLNPLMHIFIFITLIFSIAFLFFGNTPAVLESNLYAETAKLGGSAVNLWGIVGLAAVVFHFTGLLIRGRIGTMFLQFAMYCGFFVWLWASILFFNAGLWLHLLVRAVPNLLFWAWYAWQWRRRYQQKEVAFV